MREMKFRGKKTEYSILNTPQDSGIWFYWNILEGFSYVSQFVVPETIDQFTGLEDKNDNEIYDRDICKGLHDFGPGGFHEKIFEVMYHRILGYQWNCWDLSSLEVIGNTHDNPELARGI